jgi:hypothetical protein
MQSGFIILNEPWINALTFSGVVPKLQPVLMRLGKHPFPNHSGGQANKVRLSSRTWITTSSPSFQSLVESTHAPDTDKSNNREMPLNVFPSP